MQVQKYKGEQSMYTHTYNIYELDPLSWLYEIKPNNIIGYIFWKEGESFTSTLNYCQQLWIIYTHTHTHIKIHILLQTFRDNGN